MCGRLLPIAAATVRERFPEVAIRLTQVGRVGSTEWGGSPRPRGGPCLRFRQRDEDSRAVQGDRPTKALPERLCGRAFYAATRSAAAVGGFRVASHKAAGEPDGRLARVYRVSRENFTPPRAAADGPTSRKKPADRR